MEAGVKALLQGALSPVQQEVAASEAALRKAEEEHESFPAVVAGIAINRAEPVGLRQLALLLLQQYVRRHWTALSEQYVEGTIVPSEATKAAVRQSLIPNLADPTHRVRTVSAYVLAKIAYWDWPDHFPQLFPALVDCLKSGDANAVHGAMRCLSEFTSVITDQQIPVILPQLLPELLHIATNPQLFSCRVRCRAISVLRACLTSLYMLSETHKSQVSAMVKQVTSQWLPAFTAIFTQIGPVGAPTADESDGLLRMEVLQSLALLVKSFPQSVKDLPPALLQVVWSSLVTARDAYVTSVVHSDDGEDASYDSDGDAISLAYQVSALFDLVREMSERKKLQAMLRQSLDTLIYLLIAYLQISEEQVSSWLSDVNQYSQDTDENEYLSVSVRSSSQELLMTLCMSFTAPALVAVVAAVSRHCAEAVELRGSSSPAAPHWWKQQEAAMAAVGLLAEELSDAADAGRVQFSFEQFARAVVVPSATDAAHPFLRGRALWLASRITPSLPDAMSSAFLDMAVHALEPSVAPVVRVDALRALMNFMQSCDGTEIAPHAPCLLASLPHLAASASEDLLTLCAEALRMCIAVSGETAVQHREMLVPFVLQLWERGRDDLIASSAVVDIVDELAALPACRETLLRAALPTVLHILRTPTFEAAVQGIALQVLCAMLRFSTTPIEASLMTDAFPLVAHIAITTQDDSQLVHEATACLRYFVLHGAEQIASWSSISASGSPESGLQVLMNVIAHELRASSETATSNVGELVLTVVRRMGGLLGDLLPQLLRAVLDRLANARSLALTQSLLLVFARLMLDHLDDVLAFLVSVRYPTDSGAEQDGFQVLMEKWCEHAHDFTSAFSVKISTLALLRLYMTRNPRLLSTTVPGDIPVQVNEGRQLRSRTKKRAEERPRIPLAAKLLKTLVGELATLLENKHGVAPPGEEDDGDWVDSGDEEDEDEEGDDVADYEGTYQARHGTPFASADEIDLSELLEAGNDGDEINLDDAADARDPAVRSDPYYGVDLAAELLGFFRAEAVQPAAVPLLAYFGEAENDRLKFIMGTIVKADAAGK